MQNKLVPVEPTDGMIDAAIGLHSVLHPDRSYKAMTQSCPTVEVVDVECLKNYPSDYCAERPVEYYQGWNACLDHLKRNGFKIIREVK